ncbi:cobalt-precorrin-5B (C(1))-methyltransferase, partial [Clostridium butyricum]|uniref:cobalt-precorrin-5B (C(1))-methyltransferase n=2 Tax=Eubacteriales TaxID=186802 RepID=UPI0021047024
QPVGEKAINSVPRRMIREAVREAFPQEELEITIEVPRGEETAKHTLNPRLGIVGGISILGTSGIVRPMSEEAFKTSILPELDQAVAYGHKAIVLTPGHYGFRVATEGFDVPTEAVIQMSNFVGFLLEEAVYRG